MSVKYVTSLPELDDQRIVLEALGPSMLNKINFNCFSFSIVRVDGFSTDILMPTYTGRYVEGSSTMEL